MLFRSLAWAAFILPKMALEKLEAGASLIQLYTGFIYEGPGLIKRICKALLKEK